MKIKLHDKKNPRKHFRAEGAPYGFLVNVTSRTLVFKSECFIEFLGKNGRTQRDPISEASGTYRRVSGDDVFRVYGE